MKSVDFCGYEEYLPHLKGMLCRTNVRESNPRRVGLCSRTDPAAKPHQIRGSSRLGEEPALKRHGLDNAS
ncbi:MAG: hypothetical protein ACRD2L_10000, partial [Terriglobia bacterium]